ncbi:MAG: AAA family ATPase [Nanoarchaeota archaeon]|nr:AAA family ATPase [Nanoarchaeota archaeon]
MKVALIGTHGTGKTVVVHDLVAQLKKLNLNVEFLGETVRNCPFPINEQATKQTQEWIMYNQYVNEMVLEDRCRLLICDRSILDGYVYYTSLFEENSLLELFVVEKIKTYKHLFRIPIKEGYLVDDGVRSTKPEFQKRVDEQFDYLLDKLKIPFHNYERLSKTMEIIISDA